MQRTYPELSEIGAPSVSISFVCVHFSDDLEHNLLQSHDISAPQNELILVDNRGGVSFDNLSSALAHGLHRARHEIVAFVHEDVLLPRHWQAHLEKAIDALNEHDPDWGILGSAGWSDAGELIGHYSDPHRFLNTFDGEPYQPAARLDEQLLIMKRSAPVGFDVRQPSIHFIAKTLHRRARADNRVCYVIDAPTIHKYADDSGKIISTKEESPKIRHRKSLTYRAEYDVARNYIQARENVLEPVATSAGDIAAPVVLVSRGGSGSRLLSLAAEDIGIHLGANLNPSGDDMELVPVLYKLLVAKFRAPDLVGRYIQELRTASARRFPAPSSATAESAPWGFKVPESILVLPEIHRAFPDARYIHLVRDPLTTCLRRTHMTARTDNEVGRICLREAYRALGRPVERIIEDHPAIRMGVTTSHQLDLAMRFQQSISGDKWNAVRFERLLADPGKEKRRLSDWLATAGNGTLLELDLDPKRAESRQLPSGPVDMRQLRRLLRPIRWRYGYSSGLIDRILRFSRAPFVK